MPRMNWDKKYQMWRDINLGRLPTIAADEQDNQPTKKQRQALKRLNSPHWDDKHLTKQLATEWISQLVAAKRKQTRAK